jgi:hypothetical protein
VIISPSLPSTGTFKAAMPLLKKGAKTLAREALKTGLNIAGDVVQGRNINRTKLIPESYGHGQRAIKGPDKRKKTRRRQD